MGREYGVKFIKLDSESLHQEITSLPSFMFRSAELGYFLDGFETKSANAYLFGNCSSNASEYHPCIEVIIEPWGLYINQFVLLADFQAFLDQFDAQTEFLL